MNVELDPYREELLDALVDHYKYNEKALRELLLYGTIGVVDLEDFQVAQLFGRFKWQSYNLFDEEEVIDLEKSRQFRRRFQEVELEPVCPTAHKR